VRYYVRQGQRDLARRHFIRSYNRGIAMAAPHLARAGEAEARGDRINAITQYEKAIEAGPATIEAYKGIYENNRILGRIDRAIDALLRLIFVKPDHVQAHIWLGHLYLTERVPGKSRKYCLDQSVRHLERARELDPDDPHPCYILADLYRIIGDDQLSLKYHDLAMKLDASERKNAP
jgi:tetratricopeptide (TPR) repeat protein